MVVCSSTVDGLVVEFTIGAGSRIDKLFVSTDSVTFSTLAEAAVVSGVAVVAGTSSSSERELSSDTFGWLYFIGFIFDQIYSCRKLKWDILFDADAKSFRKLSYSLLF